MKIRKLKFLSNNALKIIACITMAIDHIGFMFFPYDMIYREIGRIAFPIFAFLLAEGCKYTKNKLKHFLTLFALTIICQVGYYLFAGDTYLCILVTLCLSQLCIFSLQYFKKSLLNTDAKLYKKLLSACLFVGAIALTAVLCRLFTVEYGFWGCMLPVFASLFDFRNAFPVQPLTVDGARTSLTTDKTARIYSFIQKLDNSLTQYLCFALGLVLSVFASKTGLPQEYALFSLIPIAFYNGKKGKLNLKYFFYLFYPLHLVAIEGVYILLYFL